MMLISAAALSRPAPQQWVLPVTSLAGASLLWLAVYWPAAMAAVQTWWDSPTYSHCFLVIPISAYLVWRKREQLACATPTPEPLALLLVIPAGLLWLAGNAASVNEAMQL